MSWRRSKFRLACSCSKKTGFRVAIGEANTNCGGLGLSVVRWADGVPEIDAAVAARAMKFAVEYFLRQMQRGAIRGRVERGSGEDEGRHRLSFRHRDRELVMVVDEDGRIISQELTMATPKPHWRGP